MNGSGDAVLERAFAVQEAASRAGFDWPDVEGVLAKVREETEEIAAAVAAGDLAHARRELGDLLLVTVNLSRFLEADAAASLGEALGRFEQRYAAMRARLHSEGRDPESCTLDELDAAWESVKTLAAQRPDHGA